MQGASAGPFRPRLAVPAAVISFGPDQGPKRPARARGRVMGLAWTKFTRVRRTVITSRLTEATILRHGEEYLIRLAADDGTSLELVASFDQLDTLAEDIDRQLDADDVQGAD